ncbi:hypothetical protein [Tranquillimonas alkanivorans]|uniref:Helix-turn-helix domain-containing protein n=1 Tax=Tranquillimonas alkanivorans TaxID=441119 RepID=A0A1I5W2S2_9RHOB|nr:hypothetical protein [Tranquillimonas alkanivorans]SFQ13991.1 hypothetical protein SAMN04488047_13915 [Tranquillimonas alkanivorans]
MTMDLSTERGFTSLPRNFFASLPETLSHGARLALAHLCEQAHAATGTCSISYRLLGEKLRRSKASISNYIRELRQHELIQTEQTTRFGYKSCLVFTLPFYAQFRKMMKTKAATSNNGATVPSPTRVSGERVQEVEHRVQPAERNKMNQKDSSQPLAPNLAAHECPARSKVVSDLLEQWKLLTRGAQYPGFNAPVPSDLVRRTEKWLASRGSASTPAYSTDDLAAILADAWEDSGVVHGLDEVRERALMLLHRHPTNAGHVACRIADHIRKSWHAHWKKVSSPAQFETMLRTCSVGVVDDLTARRSLESYLRQAEMCSSPERR